MNFLKNLFTKKPKNLQYLVGWCHVTETDFGKIMRSGVTVVHAESEEWACIEVAHTMPMADVRVVGTYE